VYARDASNRVYQSDRAYPLTIDTMPPTSKVKFSPVTGKVSFYCTDDDSGCKTTFGVGYVGDIQRFFPALFGNSQSASRWCPTNPGVYSFQTNSEMNYNMQNNELRVLCLRTEDQAGNSAVSMTTVFNMYDTLAKSLALYMND
jgi:hypothetical protein